MSNSVTDIQDGIAQTIVNAIPQKWERIVVNYEVTHDEGPDSNYVFFYIIRSAAGDLSMDSDLGLPDDVEDMFFQLNDALLSSAGQRWGICDLTIQPDGTYNYEFDYGPAKRLNGVLDDSSLGRFNNYLAGYKAELAAQPEA